MTLKLLPAAFILSLSAASVHAQAPAAATPEQVEAGKKDYMTVCVACHQPTGAGLPTVFPSLVKSEYVNGSAERLVALVLKGITPPFEYQGVTYTQVMIPQEAVLTDEKIASILTFVRASFENSAPPIAADFVASVRKKFAERKTPWTAAELKDWKETPPAAN